MTHTGQNPVPSNPAVVRSQTKPLDFQIQGKDNGGAVIQRIYYQHGDFVVYRNDHSIKIDIDEQSANRDALIQKHSKIAVLLGKIYSWLPENLSWSEAINRQIARSIAENALGNYDHAAELLNHVTIRIRNLKTMHGRLQYTLSSLAVVGVMLIFLFILSVAAYKFPDPLLFLYYRFAKISFCGALGGLFSVSLGFPRLQIDIDADRKTNCLIGASRIFISIAGAFFAYFAIEAGIAFAMFKGPNSTDYGLYVMAMVAGFSEMLIPNLMANLTATADRDHPPTNSVTPVTPVAPVTPVTPVTPAT